MTSQPDFYLSSTEGYDMESVRRSWRIKRMATANRDDLLLIEIDPPLIGQKYGLGDRDVKIVVIAPRHEGTSLFPIKEWPLSVHVARLLIDNPKDRNVLSDHDFESIGWAELYRTEDDARLKRM
jgi:hypothetical protein